MKSKLSNKEIASFCEQMEMIFQSGISATEGLTLMIEDQQQEGSYKNILKDLKMYMEEMGLFSVAIKECEAFPEYVESMTELGERTGTLDEVMRGISKYYQREDNLIEDIKHACSYPLMMTGMMLVIVLVLIVKVFPVFESVYEQMGSQMSGAAVILLRISHGLNTYYPVCIGVVVVLVAGIWGLVKTERGKKKLKEWIQHYMNKSTLFYQINVSRFALISSMTLKTGMDLESAFEMTKKFMEDSPTMVEQLKGCWDLVQEGKSLGEASREVGIFTGMDARLLRVSERTGSSVQALENISERIDKEVTIKIQNIVAKLEPTLVAILSILVGIILLSVMLPLMGILSNI